MNYYYDCEFLEGTQKKIFGETVATIDLISIGVVAEDGREFYEVSKEFNLKEAWNRFDWKRKTVNDGVPGAYKDYWIRENVLKPIFDDFIMQAEEIDQRGREVLGMHAQIDYSFTYKNFKRLLKTFGKSRAEIKFSLTSFLLDPSGEFYNTWLGSLDDYYEVICKKDENVGVDLYGYYSAYDHVCLSWIYGKMVNLPEAIPMYTKDLKQILDSKKHPGRTLEDWLDMVKSTPYYPATSNEHNALADAKWNLELHKFITNHL